MVAGLYISKSQKWKCVENPLLQTQSHIDNPRKKIFANGKLFLIHEKTFANDDNPLRIYSFLVQLLISQLTTPIFPTKVATVEALQSNTRQCSSYSGHIHLQLLNRVTKK